MRDCSNQIIKPITKRLEIHTNKHPNCDGTSWGWIDGCDKNIVWSNNKEFNYKKASEFVKGYNDSQKEE